MWGGGKGIQAEGGLGGAAIIVPPAGREEQQLMDVLRKGKRPKREERAEAGRDSGGSKAGERIKK